MKLHYSQTVGNLELAKEAFYYLMKLHYSQTTPNLATFLVVVLLPYEITLFSNKG